MENLASNLLEEVVFVANDESSYRLPDARVSGDGQNIADDH